jgi:hypothetical protein
VAGGSRVRVAVEDESATGFGVTTDQTLQVQHGDVVQLRTDAGAFEVRVVRIAIVEAAATANGPKRARGRALRLGLERIRDLTAVTDRSWRSIRWRDVFFPPWIPSPRTSTVIVGILLLLLVFIVPVATILYLRGPDQWILPQITLRQMVGWLGLSEADRPRQSPDSTGADGWPRPGPEGPGHSGADRPPLAIPETLYPALERLLDRAAQTGLDALRTLDLTPGQQRRLQQLLEETAEAFLLLDSQRANLSPLDQARIERELLEAARRQTFELLTDEQQKAWQALLANPPAPEKQAPPTPPGGKPDGGTL